MVGRGLTFSWNARPWIIHWLHYTAAIAATAVLNRAVQNCCASVWAQADQNQIKTWSHILFGQRQFTTKTIRIMILRGDHNKSESFRKVLDSYLALKAWPSFVMILIDGKWQLRSGNKSTEQRTDRRTEFLGNFTFFPVLPIIIQIY